ncbi:MAG: methyltransferase domain-containing protein [Actinomycetota bacterium]
MSDSGWDEHAEWWIERFAEGDDLDYANQIIPLAVSELAGASTVVDVGAGEGQLGRALADAHGCRVIGIDPTEQLVATAAAQGAIGVRAEAQRLPLADASVDGTLVALVLEHVDDLDAAVAEIARVTRPGGRFALFLNHPIIQTPGSGLIDDHTIDPPEWYWRLGPYLVEHAGTEQVERGVHLRFVHRPLSRYVNELAEHGFVIERMVEPSPSAAFSGPHGEAAAYPRLMYLRCRRTADPRSFAPRGGSVG